MIVERGHGSPIVLIPGIQGRWAYMSPAVDALARRNRVVTFDLCGEPGCGQLDPARGMSNYVEQIDRALDQLGLRSATICGVSFGGLIAVHFAARRPDRTSALVLVSAPGPGFHLRSRHQLYARMPRLFGPVFFAELPRRVRHELRMAIPGAGQRLRFSSRQIATFLRAPVSVTRMAARARLIGTEDVRAACEQIAAPTLVVSGEPSLDHVVSADGTAEYARLIRDAEATTLPQTGHLGFVTRPIDFAAIVHRFLADRHLTAAAEVNDAA